MTISFSIIARRPRNGLQKKIRLQVVEFVFAGGLSPFRGHGGVRYAEFYYNAPAGVPTLHA